MRQTNVQLGRYQLRINCYVLETVALAQHVVKQPQGDAGDGAKQAQLAVDAHEDDGRDEEEHVRVVKHLPRSTPDLGRSRKEHHAEANEGC